MQNMYQSTDDTTVVYNDVLSAEFWNELESQCEANEERMPLPDVMQRFIANKSGALVEVIEADENEVVIRYESGRTYTCSLSHFTSYYTAL